MDRLLLKIRELEREAQILIEQEPGSDSMPLGRQLQPKCKERVQEEPQFSTRISQSSAGALEDGDRTPKKCKELLQKEPRVSPRLSTAGKSNAGASDDGNQTPKKRKELLQQEPRFSPRLSTAGKSNAGALDDGDQTPKQKCKEPLQPEPRFSPRLSTAGKSNAGALDDGNQALSSCKSKEPSASRDGDWVRQMTEEAGRWNGNKLVVLSLFDGIGGVWAALSRLGIPFRGYSSEVSAPAVEVVKARFPEVLHLGDVRKLQRKDIGEDVDLLVGGFPCQDLSCMGKREGLHGQRSRLFFDLLEVMKVFQPKWFLVENVASMTWIDRLEISKYTGVRPLELDSIELTPTRRRRLYWTNIPHPLKLPRVRDHPSTLVQSCLQDAIALEEKTGVILGNTSESSNSYNVEKAYVDHAAGLRKLAQAEVECMLGFLPHHTAVRVSADCKHFSSCARLEKTKSSKAAAKGARKGAVDGKYVRKEPLKAAVRWLLLGNTFSVQVIAYLLSPLLKRSVRDLGQPVHSSRSISEKDCSVMEVGDVWALYNEQERPNWYALIVNRTGDRFSAQKLAPSAKATKKLPLQVELNYLEITPAYSRDEEDKWNPLRGTGLYEARDEVDMQESWTAFSHRVTSFIRTSNRVFIFPGKHELWTVYCHRIWSPFFVYVIESTINISTLSSVSPKAEGFSARCYLVIKTGEHETYRRTEKVLELDDLSIFCFQVPYSFKQQADLMKVEIGTGGRRSKKVERDIRKMRKRKRKEEGSSSLDEAEKEEEIFVDQGKACNEDPVVAAAAAAVAADDATRHLPHLEDEDDEQECVLEVDLGCQCQHTRREESDSEVDTSAGEVIILDDDDDDDDDE